MITASAYFLMWGGAMQIVVLDGYTLNPGDLSWDSINAFGDLTIYDRSDDKDVLARIGNAEIVLVNKTSLSRDVFEQAPNLKFVCLLATGYDRVDAKAASEKGIPVSNVPDYSTPSVAETAFALLLQLCWHIGEHSAAVKNGEWTKSKDFCLFKFPMSELNGKTIGIIGFGRIGQRVAGIALSFGMSVLAYSPRKTALEHERLKYVTLDELLQNSDVVSLHCPLKDETRGIISKDAINKMKDGAMLINTSRGALVDEYALSEALNSGKLAGAGCDVVSAEPIHEDNPLLTAKNIYISPHIGWASIQSRQRLMKAAADNIKAFLNGSPINTVN